MFNLNSRALGGGAARIRGAPGTSATFKLRRGRLVSFDAATWTAIVRLDGAGSAATMPCGEWVSADSMVLDDKVAVILFDDQNPNDGLIVGPYGGLGPDAYGASLPAVASASAKVYAYHTFI